VDCIHQLLRLVDERMLSIRDAIPIADEGGDVITAKGPDRRSLKLGADSKIGEAMGPCREQT